jgi:chemosensory pili system protein ChpA (sensor histidine kinase/response regulator)
MEHRSEIFAMQPEPLQQIMGYYIEDAKKYLQVIEPHLLNLPSTIEDPGIVSELLGATRCGIVGAANLLPISSLHISSIHKIGFCLVECFTVFQHERSLRVDQKLEDLLMEVFYTLNSLIEQLREPSSLTEAQAKQVMSEIELIREALMAHVNWLVKESRSANLREVPLLPDSADGISSLEDLESLIDELLLDSSSA